jgi:hypothetical protein
MKTRYLFLLLTVFMLAGLVAFAQQKIPLSKSDSAGVAKIAAKLSVSKVKAKQIQAAYNYNQDKIVALMRDTTMKPAQHIEQLKKLTRERRMQIEAVVTPAQKDSLKGLQVAAITRADNSSRKFEQQHEAQLNKVPHKTSPGISKTDSIHYNPNPKPRTKI